MRQHLTTLIQLQRQGEQQQARDTLNHRLINAIRTSGQKFPERLFPVDVHIDNAASPDWTVMHVTAEDTPGFFVQPVKRPGDARLLRASGQHSQRAGKSAG